MSFIVCVLLCVCVGEHARFTVRWSNGTNRSLAIDSKWASAECMLRCHHMMHLGPNSVGNLWQFRKIASSSECGFCVKFSDPDTLSTMAAHRCRRDDEKNCWIKPLFLFSLRTKITSQNYSWTPDVTWTLLPMFLHTFLDLGTLQLYCCLWRVWELSDLIKNILICVLKMNEGLMGLERHEVE